MTREHGFPGNNALFIVYKGNNGDDIEETVSYSKCIDNLYKREKTKLNYNKKNYTEAMRNAIFDGSRWDFILDKDLYIDNKLQGKCDACNIYGCVEIDHKKPFREILKEFEETHPELLPISICKSNTIVMYTIQNDEIKDVWKTFHDYHAQFQILCQKCNLKKH